MQYATSHPAQEKIYIYDPCHVCDCGSKTRDELNSKFQLNFLKHLNTTLCRSYISYIIKTL